MTATDEASLLAGCAAPRLAGEAAPPSDPDPHPRGPPAQSPRRAARARRVPRARGGSGALAVKALYQCDFSLLPAHGAVCIQNLHAAACMTVFTQTTSTATSMFSDSCASATHAYIASFASSYICIVPVSLRISLSQSQHISLTEVSHYTIILISRQITRALTHAHGSIAPHRWLLSYYQFFLSAQCTDTYTIRRGAGYSQKSIVKETTFSSFRMPSDTGC